MIADLDSAEFGRDRTSRSATDTGRRVDTIDARRDGTGRRCRRYVTAPSRPSARLDILVHNAGIMHDWTGLDETPDEKTAAATSPSTSHGPCAITRAAAAATCARARGAA